MTNSEKIEKDDFTAAVKSGMVFIGGWTASLNATLSNYKEGVQIIFKSANSYESREMSLSFFFQAATQLMVIHCSMF